MYDYGIYTYISGARCSVCVWMLLFSVIAVGHMWTVSKIFLQLCSQLCLRQLALRWAWKMTLMKDSQKDCWKMSTYCTRNSSCIGSNIRIGSWSVSTYRMSMYSMQALLKSCVDRLNTEGSRDSASQMMRRNSRLLFLWDTSSKDYVWKARLCSNLAYRVAA